MTIKLRPRMLFPFFLALLGVFLFIEVAHTDQLFWHTKTCRDIPWWWDGDHKTTIKILCCTKDAQFQADVEAAIKAINDLGTSWQLEKTTDPVEAHLRVHEGKLNCRSAGKTRLRPGLVHRDSQGRATGVEVWQGEVIIKSNKTWAPGERVDVMSHEFMHGCRCRDTTNAADKMHQTQRPAGQWCTFSAHDIQELKDTDAASSQTSVGISEPPYGVKNVWHEHRITLHESIDLSLAVAVDITPFNPTHLNVGLVTWDSQYIYASLQPTADAMHNEFFWISVLYIAGFAETYGILVVNSAPLLPGLHPHAIAAPHYLEMDYGDPDAYIDSDASYHDDPSLDLTKHWQINSEESFAELIIPFPPDVLTLPWNLEPGEHTVTLWVSDDYAQWSSDTCTVVVYRGTDANPNLWARYE